MIPWKLGNESSKSNGSTTCQARASMRKPPHLFNLCNLPVLTLGNRCPPTAGQAYSSEEEEEEEEVLLTAQNK
jgi:hypothetical protein